MENLDWYLIKLYLQKTKELLNDELLGIADFKKGVRKKERQLETLLRRCGGKGRGIFHIPS